MKHLELYRWEYLQNPVSGVVLKVLPSEAKRLRRWGWIAATRLDWERYEALHARLHGLALVRN